MSQELDNLIEALSNPKIYPHNPTSVQVVQTHISVVFIADDLVYKIKKPMDLGFLDYTTLEKRQFFCQREVDLNSRFSKGIYLDVASICRGRSGINLSGEGAQIDAAVVMKRIPEDNTLISMLRNEAVTPDILDRIADRIADIHAESPTSVKIARYGSIDTALHNVEENFIQTVPFVGRTIDSEKFEEIRRLSEAFLHENEELFHERVDRGFIRDCHGDLHLEHVIVMNGVMLVDCIEFNERFRYCDTASDIGFLLMDLDFNGYPAYSERVSRRYIEASGDSSALDILRFYKSYRAFVRGKVNGFSLDEPEVTETEKQSAAETSRDYFALSLAYFKPKPPPILILMCGVSGSGKSYLASRLGERIGVDPVRSDYIRKQIYSVENTKERLDISDEEIYTSTATERTYSALFDAASSQLSTGKAVILDATFSRRGHRRRAIDTARRVGARVRVIACVAPEPVLRDRVTQRLRRGDDPSDADVSVLEKQLATFDPISVEESPYVTRWDSTSDIHVFLMNFVRNLMVSYGSEDWLR